jgi:polar amino acid transport system substrate-binding protein
MALLCLLVWPSLPVSAQTLRINDTNSAPLTTPAGDGFLDIIAGTAFSRAGVELKLIKLPAERALINANSGIDDGDLVRIKGLEKQYPNLIRVPEKLIDWEFVGFSKQVDLPSRWPKVREHVVGHITGWKIYEQRLQGAPHVVTAIDPEQLFYLLKRDRIEIALFARWMGQAYIEKLGLQKVHQLEPGLESREMFTYLHKSHARLVPRIARALRELKRDGTYQRLYREKLTPYSSK